jgi:hypothetical protein
MKHLIVSAEGDLLNIVDVASLVDATSLTVIDVPDEAAAAFGRGEAVWDSSTRTIVADLGQLEAHLLRKIDCEAGAFRTRFITDVPGQQLTYDRKEREARAWLAAIAPDLGDFPFLAAEAEATDLRPAAAAAAIVAAADQWAVIGSSIERERIRAKRAVTAAATAEAKRAAAVVDWEGLLP